MPNRYEREIEEILRNLEFSDPKSGRVQRFERQRRQAGSRRSRQAFLVFNFSSAEWLLVVAIVAALVAGGYAYALGVNLLTLIVAGISLVCLILVALSQFLFSERRISSVRYGNVTVIPLRRNFFGAIKMQCHLLLLKMRYWRGKKR